MKIGPYQIAPALGLAPMAGVTDKPFRLLCRRMGAGLATSEMTSANPKLRGTRKSAERLDHLGEPGPISVQIAGTEPEQMADFARYNVEHGAEIIDINMGCPAKKVCKAWAGSALMRDEALVEAILRAVVGAVDIPVTLKIRTGWAADRRNAPVIGRIAEDAGIAALAVHGRTRDQKYQGTAEYDTIAEIKQSHPRPEVSGHGRIRHDRGDQAELVHPGLGQWRHRFAGASQARARVHAGRRPADRPRRPGPAVDLQRDPALPGNRRTAPR